MNIRLLILYLTFVTSSSFAIRISDFCRNLPKIELHAHLHGSIRPSTMIDLVQSYPSLSYELNTVLNGSRNLDKCFGIFRILHHLVSNKSILKRVVHEVLDDYLKDNVIYLELRTTPRDLKDGTTKLEYLNTILEVIDNFNEKHYNQMIVKLIVSIDRSKDIDEATEILNIILNLLPFNNNIIGLDFSGNPTQKSFRDFSSLFYKARNEGLRVTVHAGELPPNLMTDDKEFDSILDFNPDRIGHGLYLSTEQIDKLLNLSRKPGIEICPTSNYFTMNLNSYDEHPTFQTWLSNNYPISINTDDFGVFDTTLSQEYQLIQSSYGLSNQDLLSLSETTIDQIFAKDLINTVRSLFLLKLNEMKENNILSNVSLKTKYIDL